MHHFLSFSFSDMENIFPDRSIYDIPYFPNMRDLFQGHRAVIPCWVSNPNVTVRFLKDSYQPWDQKPIGPEDGVFWDPKQGFIIENPDKTFDGMYKCETDQKTLFFVFRILCKYAFIVPDKRGYPQNIFFISP